MKGGHSLSVWNVSTTAVWVVQFGGLKDLSKLNDTTVIELSKYCLLMIVFVI